MSKRDKEPEQPPKFKVVVEFTDFKKITYENCLAVKWDSINMIIQHADMSLQYFNRQYVKMAHVWEVKPYRYGEYDEEMKREMNGV